MNHLVSEALGIMKLTDLFNIRGMRSEPFLKLSIAVVVNQAALDFNAAEEPVSEPISYS